MMSSGTHWVVTQKNKSMILERNYDNLDCLKQNISERHYYDNENMSCRLRKMFSEHMSHTELYLELGSGGS